MAYLITGTLTFVSQANRDAAKTRIDSALSGLNLTAAATTFTAGIATPTANTLTISFSDGNDGSVASTAAQAIYSAAVQSNRHTSGYLSVNLIP